MAGGASGPAHTARFPFALSATWSANVHIFSSHCHGRSGSISITEQVPFLLQACECEAKLGPVQQRELRARARERAHEVRGVADDRHAGGVGSAMSDGEGPERARIHRSSR